MIADELWQQFCLEKNIDPDTPYQAWQFGGLPDNLAALVTLGVKTATASGYDFYLLDDEEPMPKAGDYSVVLNSMNQALCVIQTTRVYIERFDQVSEEHAFKEGEGDRSLAYWRKVHTDFFKETCDEYEIAFDDSFKVVCEEFSCVYSVYDVREMTEEEAREVCTWRYPGEYSVYNFYEWEKCKELGFVICDADRRKGAYHTVLKNGEFLGFFHLMNKGDHIELGVGMKPELCGNHNGNNLMNLALAKIEEKFGPIRVTLTVRPFNKRAIKCYEDLGFKIIKEYYEADYIVPGDMYLMEKYI